MKAECRGGLNSLAAKEKRAQGQHINAEDSSVVGEAEGRLDKIVELKQWLSIKGSLKSKIESNCR